MRETSLSSPPNTIQCFWLAETMEISVFLFSGLKHIDPVKYYGGGDSVLLTCLLNHHGQLFSRVITAGDQRLQWACSYSKDWAGLLEGNDYCLGANPAWEAWSVFLEYVVVVFCSQLTYLFYFLPFWCRAIKCPCVVRSDCFGIGTGLLMPIPQCIVVKSNCRATGILNCEIVYTFCRYFSPITMYLCLIFSSSVVT